MKDRIIPSEITELKDNEIFVFGSNTGGRHGKGRQNKLLHGVPFGVRVKDYKERPMEYQQKILK